MKQAVKITLASTVAGRLTLSRKKDDPSKEEGCCGGHTSSGPAKLPPLQLMSNMCKNWPKAMEGGDRQDPAIQKWISAHSEDAYNARIQSCADIINKEGKGCLEGPGEWGDFSSYDVHLDVFTKPWCKDP